MSDEEKRKKNSEKYEKYSAYQSEYYREYYQKHREEILERAKAKRNMKRAEGTKIGRPRKHHQVGKNITEEH